MQSKSNMSEMYCLTAEVRRGEQHFLTDEVVSVASTPALYSFTPAMVVGLISAGNIQH